MVVVTDFGMWILDGETLDDGQWLASYDVDAHDGLGEAIGTADPGEALRFPDVRAVLEAWKEQSTVEPLRLDGKPNRPLSAFTIQPRPLP